MTETFSPPAGWYPDPSDGARLRRWDGTAWTDNVKDLGPSFDRDGGGESRDPSEIAAPETSTRGATPPAAIGTQDQVSLRTQSDGTICAQNPRNERPRRLRKGGTNAIVGVMLAAFAVVGAFEVASGGSTGRNSATGFAAGPTTTTTEAAASRGPCSAGQPAAGALVEILSFNGLALSGPAVTTTTEEGLVGPAEPAQSTSTTVPGSPAGTCSTATFHDQRGLGPDLVTVYSTQSAANRAAEAATSGSVVHVGYVVLRLEAAVKVLTSQYAAVISRALPSTPPTSSRTSSAS